MAQLPRIAKASSAVSATVIKSSFSLSHWIRTWSSSTNTHALARELVVTAETWLPEPGHIPHRSGVTEIYFPL